VFGVWEKTFEVPGKSWIGVGVGVWVYIRSLGEGHDNLVVLAGIHD
jgi:hypothetical protein